MNSMNSSSSVFERIINRKKHEKINDIDLKKNNKNLFNFNNNTYYENIHHFYDTDIYVGKNDDYDDDEDDYDDIRKYPLFWIFSLILFCIFYYTPFRFYN